MYGIGRSHHFYCSRLVPHLCSIFDYACMVSVGHTIFIAVGQYHIYVAYLITHVWYQPVMPPLLVSAGTAST
jgi:hypothetical protein